MEGLAMLKAVRMFLWRHQKFVAIAYLCAIVFWSAALIIYKDYIPAHIDTALTMATRSIAYHRTFREVATAKDDFEQRRFDRAEKRLVHFVKRHVDIQPSQLFTHAVTDACELLANIYLAQNKPRKADEVLAAMSELTPLNYRLWYLRGLNLKETGDFTRAADCLHEAFKLVPDHSQVAEAYLAVLDELGEHDAILWVDDRFRKASRDAARVEMMLGIPRTRLQQRVMQLVGIPVSHGKYFSRADRAGIDRGKCCRLNVPSECFQPWEFEDGQLYVQLRFESIYERLHIESIRYQCKGEAWREKPLTPQVVRYLHRPHSGKEYYAELNTGLDATEIEGLQIIYSCHECALSKTSKRIVAKARANQEARKGV